MSIRDFMKRFRDRPVIQEIISRNSWVAPWAVDIKADRADDDWLERVDEMRGYCTAECIGRWRMAAPMGRPLLRFQFEKERDAMIFKLRFG